MPAIEPHIASLLRRRTSRDLYEARDQEPKTFGERMADNLATGAGSWTFILCFLGFLIIWMAVNAVAWIHHWDPYPFILLNLVLSCVAAIQAPIILMSQNREEARDRVRAKDDYEVNLKAELLLEHLTKEIEMVKALLLNAQVANAADAATLQAAEEAARGIVEAAAGEAIEVETTSTTVIRIDEPPEGSV